MTRAIINDSGEIIINRRYIQKKNNTIVATYYALYAENRHRQKALMSITIGDERVSTLKEYRRAFMRKLNSIMRRKANRENVIQYFSNIEMGQDMGSLSKLFNPHLHIQFFFDDITPIEETMAYMSEQYKLSNSDLTTPTKEDADYDYVIKDYQRANYNEVLETNKCNLYKKQALHTCSRKSIPNYVIKYLYKHLATKLSKQWNRLKSYERYEFILHHIKEGNISITTLKERPSNRYRRYKNSAIYVNYENMKTV